MRSYNLADLFEGVVDAVPDRPALACIESPGESTGEPAGGQDAGREVRLTFAGLDTRANRAANAFAAMGIGAGDHVGVGTYNGNEFIEVLLGLYKLRAVPVNVNFRYGTDELRYLFHDADLRSALVEPDLVQKLESVRDALPLLGDLVTRGSDYEARLAAASPERPDASDRTSDDLFLIYTGGTTGMPKGVMWRHEDIFFAAMGGAGTPAFGIEPLHDPARVGEWATKGSPLSPRLPLCPLMHGGALWLTLQELINGGCVVLSMDRHYDARNALDLLAAERVAMTMVIGDAVMRPVVDALAADPERWDLSGLRAIASGGAILSPSTKERLADLLPHVKVSDTFGASESGGQGRLIPPGVGAVDRRPRLRTDDRTALFDDDLTVILPVSRQVGRLGRRGWIPLGYYKDPERSAQTFPTVDGVRWSVPGDLAQYDDEGALVLLGRGAVSINTGGEKVYPEEVESVLKGHDAVLDAVVVGVPDDRFGERVAAVVSLRDGRDWPGDAAVSAWAHDRISGYKVPREWVLVDAVERLPTGKPDYRWAKRAASPSAS